MMITTTCGMYTEGGDAPVCICLRRVIRGLDFKEEQRQHASVCDATIGLKLEQIHIIIFNPLGLLRCLLLAILLALLGLDLVLGHKHWLFLFDRHESDFGVPVANNRQRARYVYRTTHHRVRTPRRSADGSPEEATRYSREPLE